MPSRWVEIGRLQREHGARTCRVVNAAGEKDHRCTGEFVEGHHGIFEGQKSKKEKEWRFFLDHPINYCTACHSCNFLRVGDPDEARYQFCLLQIKRYGKTQMRVWLLSAPDEIKERHEFARYWKEVSDG